MAESLVTSVSDEFFVYTIDSQNGRPNLVKTPHTQRSEEKFFKGSENLERYYSKRYGVIIGQVDIIVNARLISGNYYGV